MDEDDGGALMNDKDKAVRVLDAAVGRRFNEQFEVRGEQLGSNHVVYRSRTNHGIEVSVVATATGSNIPRYSVQVEVDMTEPDCDIAFIGDDLSLDEVLTVLGRYSHHA